MIPKTHCRVVLARRPPGEPSETDFRIEEVAVPEPGPGQVLVRVIYLSLDPYMRGRMRPQRLDVGGGAAPLGRAVLRPPRCCARLNARRSSGGRA
jgi:NADPH-dependent curcumin reductase CurA